MLNSQKVANNQQTELTLINIDFDHFVQQHLEQMIAYLAKGKISKFDSTLAIDDKGNLLIIKKEVKSCNTSKMYCIKYRFSPMMRYKLNDHDFATRILEVYQRYLMVRFKKNRTYIRKIFRTAENFPEDPLFTPGNYIDFCFDNLDKLTATNKSLPSEYVMALPDYFENKALISLQSFDHITFKMWAWITDIVCNLPDENATSNVLFKTLCNVFSKQFNDNNREDIKNFDYTKLLHNCNFMHIKRLKMPIPVIFDNLEDIERLSYTKIILSLQTHSDIDKLFKNILYTSRENRLFQQQVLATFLLNVFECQVGTSARKYLQSLTFHEFTLDKIKEYILNYH